MLLLQNGYTALHIAAKKNELEIAQLLLDQKADPGARSKVRQSLHAMLEVRAPYPPFVAYWYRQVASNETGFPL